MKFSPLTLFLILSLTLSACSSSESTKNSNAQKAELDQAPNIFAISAGSYGFRYNFDPEEKFLELLKSSPGTIELIDSSPLIFSLHVDGKDFRDGLKPSKATINDNKVSSYRFDQKNYSFEITILDEKASYKLDLTAKKYIDVSYIPPDTQLTEAGLETIELDGFNLRYKFKSPEGKLPPELNLENGQSITIEFVSPYYGMYWANMLGLVKYQPIRLTGPTKDVAAIKAFNYRLAFAYSQPNPPMGPFGASSARYDGHVFWDSDMWIFPALALTNSYTASQILQFRSSNLNQLKTNASQWVENGRPMGNTKKRPYKSSAGDQSTGIKFPWESSPDATESSPTETAHQAHVSASVAFAFRHAKALNLVPPNIDGTHLLEEVKNYYQYRIEQNPDKTYSLNYTISPSEWHTVNNDLYTNALLEVLFDFPMRLPKDKTTYLTFDDDPLREYQQTAALLAVFPVQHPEIEKEAAAMLDRFADKTSPYGPAMSHSIHATIAARLGQTERAYNYWKKSWQLYTDDPAFTFREKPNTGDTYFYTGAAGCLNSVIYGFIGLRLDPFEPQNKPWKTPLRNGFWLSADPNLPKQWEQLEIDIDVLGKKTTLVATHRGLTAKPTIPTKPTLPQ